MAHLAPGGLHPILCNSYPKPHWGKLDSPSSLWGFFLQAILAHLAQLGFSTPLKEPGPAASLGPSGPLGLASHPDQKFSQASLAPEGCGNSPVGKCSSSLSWPIWPLGACIPSCSTAIQSLPGPTWLSQPPCRTFGKICPSKWGGLRVLWGPSQEGLGAPLCHLGLLGLPRISFFFFFPVGGR